MYEYLSENSIYSQGPEAVSSAESFSDIPQYVLSRLNLIEGLCFYSASETESCRDFRFGTTCEHFEGSRGAGASMLCAVDSRVRTLVALGEESGSTANEAGCGQRWHVSLAKYDRCSSSWKIAHGLFTEEQIEFSGIWPHWGWMQDLELFPARTPALSTRGKDYSFLPTPVAQDRGGYNQSNGANAKKRYGLRGLARRGLLPTPTVHGNYNRKGSSSTSGDGLATVIGGCLNPVFVELLMMFPMGWTGLAPVETLRFQQWLNSHGSY